MLTYMYICTFKPSTKLILQKVRLSAGKIIKCAQIKKKMTTTKSI